MYYDAPLYRPPSEAYSLILQVTIGCSHNECSFCSMYKTKKFRIKSRQEIEEHIERGLKAYPSAERIFLADGNVMCMDTKDLVDILGTLYKKFPKLERISAYAGPKDLLNKSAEELKEIRNAGLALLYLGVESGSPRILEAINKEVTPAEMILAGRNAINAGYILSCTIVSGLGGKALWQEHANESARIINVIQPHYLGVLTLMLEKGTALELMARKGKFELLEAAEVIAELALMVEGFELENTVFRSNHASNYLYLKGTLNQDKEKILKALLEVRQKLHFLGSEDQRRL